MILCQIPLLLIGTAMSFIKRQETLSVVSNLVTFPMAVVSGLWWPINMLPNWLQTIGKLTPTYFANNSLSHVLTNGKVDLMNVGGVLAWLGLGVALVILMAKRTARKGVVLDHG
ncbi:ABC-type multidrug transport system, permease component [Agrilactobacillus composti DSM 18527 = JCM 14202]|nr:ABC-type multidrug transport system, permease component [Agrilactobacillus composti DSM 18527 = JCM 14202]